MSKVQEKCHSKGQGKCYLCKAKGFKQRPLSKISFHVMPNFNCTKCFLFPGMGHPAVATLKPYCVKSKKLWENKGLLLVYVIFLAVCVAYYLLGGSTAQPPAPVPPIERSATCAAVLTALQHFMSNGHGIF